jgi:lactate permease
MEITIANTAPVAYGALGTPIIALAAVTGYSGFVMGAQVGRILPLCWCPSGWCGRTQGSKG